MLRLPCRVRPVTSVLAVPLIALMLTGCGTLDEDDVKVKVGQAESAAAESQILARLVAGGSTAAPFVSIHSAELHTMEANAADALTSDAVEPPYRPRAREGGRVAHRAAVAIQRLHADPDDRAAARSIARHLGHLVDELGKVDAELQI